MEKRVFTEEDYSDFSDHTRDVGILFSAECVFLKPLLFFFRFAYVIQLSLSVYE